MRDPDLNCPTIPDARRWMEILAQYREPSLTRSVIELIITAGSFVLLWIAGVESHRHQLLD